MFDYKPFTDEEHDSIKSFMIDCNLEIRSVIDKIKSNGSPQYSIIKFCTSVFEQNKQGNQKVKVQGEDVAPELVKKMLWLRSQQTRLCEAYAAMIRMEAHRCVPFIRNTGLTVEDLVVEGFMCINYSSYSFCKDHKLMTYFSTVVRRELYKVINKANPLRRWSERMISCYQIYSEFALDYPGESDAQILSMLFDSGLFSKLEVDDMMYVLTSCSFETVDPICENQAIEEADTKDELERCLGVSMEEFSKTGVIPFLKKTESEVLSFWLRDNTSGWASRCAEVFGVTSTTVGNRFNRSISKIKEHVGDEDIAA